MLLLLPKDPKCYPSLFSSDSAPSLLLDRLSPGAIIPMPDSWNLVLYLESSAAYVGLILPAVVALFLALKLNL
jgi:hypothetical protein